MITIEQREVKPGKHKVESIALEMRVTTSDGVVTTPLRAFNICDNGRHGIGLAIDADQLGLVTSYMLDAIPSILAGLAKHSGFDPDGDILEMLLEARRATKN